MDYGKLAYMRLEELERTLTASKTVRQKNTAFSVYPDFPLREGNDYAPVRLSGNDVLMAVVKIGVNVVHSGRVGMFLDGQRIGFCDFESAGADENISLLTIKIVGDGIVTLRAENGFTGSLTALNMVLTGGDVSVNGARGVFAADSSEGICAYLSGKNECVCFTSFRESNGEELCTNAALGWGGIADLCAGRGGGFYVAYSDHSDNLWLLRVSAGGASTRVYIGRGASSVAVFDTGNNSVILAFVRSGKVFYITSDYAFGSISSETEIESDTRYDAVAFVKNAAFPTLMLSADGKVFVRFALPECGKADVFTATVTAFMTVV